LKGVKSLDLNTAVMISVFIMGLLFGSFFNVCIYRIPLRESIAFPPSHCTSCNTRLKPLDLVPVLSYLFLKGKCRYCGEKISPRYALVELLTGLIFAGLYLRYGLTFELLKFIVLSALLIIIGFIDYDTTDIYFSTILSGFICGIIFLLGGHFMNYSLMDCIYGCLLSGGIISIIVLTTRGMGWGDAEMSAMAGLYLGLYNSMVMIFFSFILGGLAGVLLIITGKKSRKDYIPFGPYIAAGALIAAFFGDSIIRWYMG
jgi:leader peptidase (prepilin peptidase)/N-methyltransferase